MSKEFRQTVWDDRLEKDCIAILRLALAEDFGASGDCTTLALVAEDAAGRAAVVARQAGIVAGLPGVKTTLALLDPRLRWVPQTNDGQRIEKGLCVGTVEGLARGLLAAERILLNLLGRLSGIATLARQYVDLVAHTKARIYDTRKTTPGWRRLEKYAVRCGGGWNHRGGLDEAVLIKDNHLALGSQGLSQFSRAPRRSRGRRKWDGPLRRANSRPPTRYFAQGDLRPSAAIRIW
jgi:nicotinate-nucleotide pyrophosphorylase (carboxylating)